MTVAAIKMESYNLGRPNEQLGGGYTYYATRYVSVVTIVT